MAGAAQPAGQGQAGQARGYGRGQAFWFGLPLGALTLGILILAVRYPARISPGTAILLGFALYVVVAFVAGYRYCSQRRHEGWESGGAGFRVGLVSAALFLRFFPLARGAQGGTVAGSALRADDLQVGVGHEDAR